MSPSAGGSGNYIYMPALQVAGEQKVGRLVSPLVSGPGSDLCVSFWYHMFGSHVGALRVKQRRDLQDGRADTLLWTVSGHQGNRWREARVLMPYSTTPYQVLCTPLLYFIRYYGLLYYTLSGTIHYTLLYYTLSGTIHYTLPHLIRYYCWGNMALSIIMYLLTLGAKYVRVSSQCGAVGATQLQKVISLIKLLLSEISNQKLSILINN